MSMEDLVRERHALEDKIRAFIASIEQFRKDARRMELRDLEIAMAKLVDAIDQATDESKRLDFCFKGILAKSVYDASRVHGPVKLGFFAGLSAGPAPWPESIVQWYFGYPFPLSEERINEWSQSPLDPVKFLPPPSLDPVKQLPPPS